MELIVTQRDLSTALSHLNRIVPNRPTHPILGNILISAAGSEVVLTAFDLSTGLTLSLEADVLTEGSLTVPGRLAVDIVSKLDGDLRLTSAEDDETGMCRLTITSDTGEYQMAALPSDEFPNLPEVENGTPLVLPMDTIKAALGHCLACASDDETKQVLTGLRFVLSTESLEVASTDGHRLAVFSVPLEEAGQSEFTVTLPKSALSNLDRLLGAAESLTLTADDRQAVFSVGKANLSCRVLDGAYPAYNQLVPRQFARVVTVDRKRLLSALERVAVMADAKVSLVKFTLEDQQRILVSVDAQDMGSATEKLPCSASGDLEEMQIAFNAKYILQALKGYGAQYINLNMNAPNQPVTITAPDSSKTLYLVMPVQIVR